MPPVMPSSARRSTAFVSGSIRATADSRSLPNHTPLGRDHDRRRPVGCRRPSGRSEGPSRRPHRSDGRGRGLARHPDAAVVGRDGRRRLDLDRDRPPRSSRGRSERRCLRARSTTQIPSAAPVPTARNRGAALAIASSSIGDLDRLGGQVLRVVPEHEVAIGVGEPDRAERDDDRLRVARAGTRARRSRRRGRPHDLRPALAAEAVRDPDGPLAGRDPGRDPERGLRGVTSPVSGSIRFTVESPWLITQRSPSSPIATPVGSSPTGIDSSNAFVPASIRATEFAAGTTGRLRHPAGEQADPGSGQQSDAPQRPPRQRSPRAGLRLPASARSATVRPLERLEPAARSGTRRRPRPRSPCARPGPSPSPSATTSSTSGGRSGRSSRHRRRRVLDVRPQHADLDIARVGSVPGQALEEQAPERVHVGALVDGIALDLLGRDVVDRPDELAGRREPAHRHGPLRQPEVRDVHMVVGREEHVAGFTSRWTSPRAWAASRALATWPTIATRATASSRPASRIDLLQVGALDVAHRDEQDAVGLVRVVDRHDVRVVDRSGELRFAEEPVAEPLAVRELGREQLERHLASEPDVLGEVDHAHAAPPDHALDPVATELGPDPRVLGHRGRL